MIQVDSIIILKGDKNIQNEIAQYTAKYIRSTIYYNNNNNNDINYNNIIDNNNNNNNNNKALSNIECLYTMST